MGQSSTKLGNNALGKDISDWEKLKLLCSVQDQWPAPPLEVTDRTFRPERMLYRYADDQKTVNEPPAPTPRWTATLRKMLNIVTRRGRSSLQSYLEPLGIDARADSGMHSSYRDDPYSAMNETHVGVVFQAISIILYDQECSGFIKSEEEGLAVLYKACKMNLGAGWAAQQQPSSSSSSSSSNNNNIITTARPLGLVPMPVAKHVDAAFRLLREYTLCRDYLGDDPHSSSSAGTANAVPASSSSRTPLKADGGVRWFATVAWPDLQDLCSLLTAVVICFKHGRAPDRRAWTNLYRALHTYNLEGNVPDVALALYHYATHRDATTTTTSGSIGQQARACLISSGAGPDSDWDSMSEEEEQKDHVGDPHLNSMDWAVDPRYKEGILSEMCRGLQAGDMGASERLRRKLAVDIYVHSWWIRDQGTKKKVRRAAEEFAVAHGIDPESLLTPSARTAPGSESRGKDIAPKGKGCRCRRAVDEETSSWIMIEK